jgi:hypothetical protein
MERSTTTRSSPRSTGANFKGSALLNDAQEPEDQDQDQNSAETDIHDTFLLLVLLLKRGALQRRSTRYGDGMNVLEGMILPARNPPDLLDFWPLARK